MALPVYADYNGLAWAFRGEPFCNVAVTLHQPSFRSLDRVFKAEPFAGTTGPVGQEDTWIYSLPIQVSFTGSVSDVAFHRPENVGSYALLRTLDIPFRGEPYVDVATDKDRVFIGLDVPFRGAPFVLTSVLPEATKISVPAAVVSADPPVPAIIVRIPASQGTIQTTVTSGPIAQTSGAIVAPPANCLVSVQITAIGVFVSSIPAVIQVCPKDVPLVTSIRQEPLYGIDSFTQISIKFDGNFYDYSQNNHAPTVNGGATATAIGVFGQAGLFLEHKDVVVYPYGTNWDFITGDFNISFRFMPKAVPSWGVNQQSQWRIAAALQHEWVPDWPVDPYYPDRGEWWGNGWSLSISDSGYGPAVSLEARQDYYTEPDPITGYFQKAERFVTVLTNIRPQDQYEDAPDVPKDEWVYVSIGRVGNQGFVIINNESKPTVCDFQLDGLNFSVDTGTELSIGGDNPYSDDPYSMVVYYSALGLIDEFQIDKGVCRRVTSTAKPPYPLSDLLVIWPVLGPTIYGFASTRAFLAVNGACKYYECLISGNGMPSFVVPISAFTSRQRAGEPSYAEMTIPGLLYWPELAGRESNGYFTVFVCIINAQGAVLQREELFTSPIGQISFFGNNENQSITLSGYRTPIENNSPKVQPLSWVTYRNVINGTYSFRMPEPDMYLKPGDTVSYDGESFTAELITYTYSTDIGPSMTVTG